MAGLRPWVLMVEGGVSISIPKSKNVHYSETAVIHFLCHTPDRLPDQICKLFNTELLIYLLPVSENDDGDRVMTFGLIKIYRT